MEQPSQPTPQQLLEKMNRGFSDLQKRYQTAMTNQDVLQPHMIPLDTFLSSAVANSSKRGHSIQTSSTASDPATAPPSGKYRCNICDTTCHTMEILNMHRAGQRHRRNDLFEKATQSLQEHGISEVAPQLWVCKLCPTLMGTKNAVLQHLEAIKHKRAVQNNLSSNESGKRLIISPEEALQAADTCIAATPISTALTVLNGDNAVADKILPPVPSPFTPSFLNIGNAMRRTQPNLSVTAPPLAQSFRTEAGSLVVSNTPRALHTNTPNRLSPSSLSCLVCSVTCNSIAKLNEHLASARHKRMQNTMDAAKIHSDVLTFVSPQIIRCKVCDVVMSGQPNFKDHLKGKQHTKNLRMFGKRNIASPSE